MVRHIYIFFFFQAEDGIRDSSVTGVQTCALPISVPQPALQQRWTAMDRGARLRWGAIAVLLVVALGAAAMFYRQPDRSEEHTSELQSHLNLVCRLLLEKKKTKSILVICLLIMHAI